MIVFNKVQTDVRKPHMLLAMHMAIRHMLAAAQPQHRQFPEDLLRNEPRQHYKDRELQYRVLHMGCTTVEVHNTVHQILTRRMHRHRNGMDRLDNMMEERTLKIIVNTFFFLKNFFCLCFILR